MPLAPNLGWRDVPLARLLADAIGGLLPGDPPVLIGNEADLGARAEHLRGAGVGTTDLVFLAGRVGIGGGIISGGRPLPGATGYAGEVGHMVVNPRGTRCRCGRSGCCETEIDEEAVLRATGHPPGTAVAEVLAAASDPAVHAGLREVGRWLGTGVANLVNLLSPQLVLLGGITGQLFPLVEDEVPAALASALPGPRASVRLALPSLGADSTLVGAAELVFAPLLDDPVGAMAVAQARSARAGRPDAATG